MTELEAIQAARLTPRRLCPCQGELHATTTESELIAGRGMRLAEFDRRLRRQDVPTSSHNEQASVRDAAEGAGE